MDEFYPRQVLDCCDVALSKHFHTMNFDPNAITRRLDDENRNLEKFVGKLVPSGTCFVISKTVKDIRINNRKIVALAATNFHAAYRLYNRQRNHPMWAIFSESRDLEEKSRKIDVLFELNTLYPYPMFSESTHEEYCYPSDLAVVALYEKNDGDQLVQLEFAEENEITVGINVIVSGHPSTDNYDYVLPGNTPDDIQKIKSGFHDFIYQVNSLGTVRNHSHTGLLELELSATAGMSGAPILIGSWPNCKIAGIYCGGPPLRGQRLITRTIDALLSNNLEEAFQFFDCFPFFDEQIYGTCGAFNAIKIEMFEVILFA